MHSEDSPLVAHRLFESFIDDPMGTLAGRVNHLRSTFQEAIETDQTDLVSLLLDDLLELINVANAKEVTFQNDLIQQYIRTDIPEITDSTYAPELEISFIQILHIVGVTKRECLQYYDLSNTILEPEIEKKANGVFAIIDQIYGEE